MLLAWMIYATALGLLIAAGAIALDRLAAIWSIPRRVVWLVALATAVVLPIALALWPKPPTPTESVTYAYASARAAPPLRIAPGVNPRPPSSSIDWHLAVDWDRPALAVWLIATLALGVLTIRGAWTTRRSRATWTASDLDGHRVLVAKNLGPAVVGVVRPDVVVPAWALTLPASEREMMLRHEAEHIAARDPLVLTLAGVALLLFPWNAAVWLIARRLQLAVEIDCDTRVLRHGAPAREYGLLLLAVSARHSLALPMAASLAERRPLLERRILAMTMLRPSRPVVASIPFAALAIIAVTAVAQTPQPVAAPTRMSRATPPAAAKPSVAPVETPAVAPAGTTATTPTPAHLPGIARATAGTVETHTPPTPRPAAPACCDVSMDSLAAWMVRYHPNVVLGDTNVTMVVFVIDADGKYVTSRAGKEPLQAGMPAKREERTITTMPDSARLTTEIRVREATFSSGNALKTMVDLDVPNEAIEGVQVLKLPGGRLAPSRIGVITIWLKR